MPRKYSIDGLLKTIGELEQENQELKARLKRVEAKHQAKLEERKRIAAEDLRRHKEATKLLRNQLWAAKIQVNEQRRKLENIKKAFFKAAAFLQIEERRFRDTALDNDDDDDD